jgi:hypothetical protein
MIDEGAEESGKTPDRILEKIKKCLALAKSDNPHEASSALRQASKLMAMHNLSMSDVDASAIGQTTAKTGDAKHRMPAAWLLQLASLISSSFECITLGGKSNRVGQSVVFIGPKGSTELAAYAFVVMRRQLEQARKAFTKTLISSMPRATKRRCGDKFVDGWLYAVHTQIKDFAGVDETVAEAINAYMRKAHPDIEDMKPSRKGKGHRMSMRDIQAINAGIAAGSDARLRRAATAGPEQEKLMNPENFRSPHPAPQIQQGSLF